MQAEEPLSPLRPDRSSDELRGDDDQTAAGRGATSPAAGRGSPLPSDPPAGEDVMRPDDAPAADPGRPADAQDEPERPGPMGAS
jgi:hypothetical protein